MSDKHTPGPWKFGYTDNLEYPVIIGADDEVVCVMREGVSIKDGDLLAMAPDLLSALIDAVELIEIMSPIEGDTLRRARAAITKATGGCT